MNNNLLQLKIKQRLNKLDSMDYDNIPCWQIAEAFNKAQRDWTRRQIHGSNPFKEGDEQSTKRIDDLQILIKTEELYGKHHPDYFETEAIPSDYMAFKRISAKAKKGKCPLRSLVIYLVEVENVELLIDDPHLCPSFDWAESFGTLSGGRVKIYTKNLFEVEEAKLVYYRFPKDVVFEDCVNPETNTVTTPQECEFKDDIIEILVSEAASILAGDIESNFQFQRNSQDTEKNN